MNKTYSFFFKQILFIVFFIRIDYCTVYAGDLNKQEIELNALIKELHSMYKDAFENEKTYITRRLFTKDGHMHYTLHVQKLKEVDGVKTHNLRLEGSSKREDPIIYINNPVEAKMPNPFLSIDQFKSAMFERIEKQKKEFDVNRNLLRNANKQFKVFKHVENLPFKIFDIKKHIKQVIDVSNNMKTKGNQNVNRKRKQRVRVSRTTKPTPKPHVMTKTVLPEETVPDNSETFDNKNETVTEIVAEEEITTESTDELTTTEATANEEINTETISDDKRTTGTPVDEEVITETASDEKNTTQTTFDHEVTAEITADDGMTTEMIADEGVTTEMIAKEEIITEPVTATEPTVRTTRTKQLRPFVFVGDS